MGGDMAPAPATGGAPEIPGMMDMMENRRRNKDTCWWYRTY